MAARSRARSADGDGQSLRTVLEDFVGTLLRRLSAVESVVSRLERERKGEGSTRGASGSKRSTPAAKRSTTAKAATARRGGAKRSTTAKATTGARGGSKKATTAKRGTSTSSRRTGSGAEETAGTAHTSRARGGRGGGAARPAASRSRVGSRASLPDAGAAPSGMGEEDLSQRREQLLSELGPPPSTLPTLGAAEGDDGGDLASEELSVATGRPEGPGPLP